MKTSEAIDQIAKAMSLAQAEMKPAINDSTNPHFRSKYADIYSVWEAIRHPLTANGLTVWQEVVKSERIICTTKQVGLPGAPSWQQITSEEHEICIITRIVHLSGQWVEFGPLSIPISKIDAHGVGSAISYGKRYALCAAIGVVSEDEDDDGNKATPKQPSSGPFVHRAFAQENPQTPPIAKTAADLIATPQMISELKSLINQDPAYLARANDFVIKEKKVTWETLPMGTYNGLMDSAKKHFNIKDGQ